MGSTSGSAKISFDIDPAHLWHTLKTTIELDGIRYGLITLPAFRLEGMGVEALLKNDFDIMLPGGLAFRGWLSTEQKPNIPKDNF